MKIAVSSSGKNLDDSIDTRFGRCQYFIIVDSESLEFEAVDNPGYQAMGGAGTLAAQTILNKDVQAVVTGECGPNAYMSLKAAEIKIFTGASGRVKDGIEQYKSSSLKEASGPTAPPHAGMEEGDSNESKK